MVSSGVGKRGRAGAGLLAILCFGAVLFIQKAGMLTPDDVSRIWSSEDVRRIQRYQRAHYDSSGRFSESLPARLLDPRDRARHVTLRADSTQYRARVAYGDGVVGCSLYEGERPPDERTLPGFVDCDAVRSRFRGGSAAALLLATGSAALTFALWPRRRSHAPDPQ